MAFSEEWGRTRGWDTPSGVARGEPTDAGMRRAVQIEAGRPQAPEGETAVRASGHLDRRAPRLRVGPEGAAQAVTAGRCGRFRSGRANPAAQRNLTAARTESLDYFGERAIGLPFVEATAASRPRWVTARQVRPALARRYHPKHPLDPR